MKRTLIVRSEKAEDDLIGLWLHIAEHDIAAADRLLDLVAATERRLIDFPELGTRRQELGPGVRMLTLGIDVFFYRFSEGTIRILRVMDGRRDIVSADLVVD